VTPLAAWLEEVEAQVRSYWIPEECPEFVPALVGLLRLAVSVVDAGRDVRDSTKGAHGLVKAADPRTVVALACALARFDAAVATRGRT